MALSSHSIADAEFADFCGDNKLDFEGLEPSKTEQLVTLCRGDSYDKVLEMFPDLDQLAQHACHAFSQHNLTREVTASLLELREMKNGFSEVHIFNFLDAEGEFTKEASSFLLYFLNPMEQADFLLFLKEKPCVERCYIVLNVNHQDIANEDIWNFLQAAAKVGIIKIDEGAPAFLTQSRKVSEESLLMKWLTVFSVGARDALTRAIYGKNAKKLLPRLGRFSINQIEQSMRQMGRYAALSYLASIESPSEFHGIKARTFYLSLHDEAHRRLISSIPNPIYQASFYAVDIVRQHVQLIWSKEIWDTVDMEVGIFLYQPQERYDHYSEEMATQDFLQLLDADVFTAQRPMGLFTESPFFETTWLLMIEIALHPEKWRVHLINPDYFPVDSIYREMYEFVLKHLPEIKREPSAVKQTAFIISQYFNLPYANNQEAVFGKQRKTNYLRLLVDRRSIFGPKADRLEQVKDFKNPRIIALIANKKLLLAQLKTSSCWITVHLSSGNPNKYQLLMSGIVSLGQLMSLSPYKIGYIDYDNIFSLMMRKLLTLEQLDQLPGNKLTYLNERFVFALVFHGKVTIEQFSKLLLTHINALNDTCIYSLIDNGILSINEFSALSLDIIRKLQQPPIYHLVKEGKLSVEVLKTKPINEIKELQVNSIFNAKKKFVVAIKKIAENGLHYKT